MRDEIRKSLTVYVSAILISMQSVAAIPTVSGVKARQRYPWNGKIDIEVTFRCEPANMSNIEFSLVATNAATRTEIPIVHIAMNGNDFGSGSVWTRKYIWDATEDVGNVKVDDILLTVDVSLGIQLWDNGPHWSKYNVGADKPEDYGCYFWWGDKVGYKRIGSSWNAVDGSKSGFSFSIDNCSTYYKTVSSLKSAGYIDSTKNLVPMYDAARAHLGSPWRMPTEAEFSALTTNCDIEWTQRNSVEGLLVKGRGAYATKSIFLPAAGFGNATITGNVGSLGLYWSSTAYSVNTWDNSEAKVLRFYSDNTRMSSNERNYGLPVRALQTTD